MVLTKFSIDRAAPKEKPYKLSDGGGLSLIVQPNSSKLWRVRYRYANKENMLAPRTAHKAPSMTANARYVHFQYVCTHRPR
jgi:hypothetical protein